MAQKTPTGGVRRSHFEYRSNGALATANEVRIDVYVDGQSSPDVTLSAAATANCAQKAGQTGLYAYTYSVAGLTAGTHILEVISIRPTSNGALTGFALADTLIDGVIASPVTTVSTDQVMLKLSGACC